MSRHTGLGRLVLMMVVGRLCTGHDALDFCDSDDGNELREQKEERKEDAECANEDADFYPRR